jgi:hypothetical protein
MKLLDIIKEQGLGDSDIPEKKLKSIHGGVILASVVKIILVGE